MQNIQTFDDIINYMSRYTNLEKNTLHYTTRNYRLDRMEKLLDHFSHPERDYKTIHVAGSKGKGSTSKFIATGLKALGYKVGLYASPHLIDYRERFTLCGDFFRDEFLIDVGKFMIKGLNDFSFRDEWGESYPTTFELNTLLGFLLFSKSNCDYAVIETGLGGRLDATNTIRPIASVLCPIELEHTNILGSTIREIAIEKSKIIKKNTPSIVATLKEEAKQVMIDEAKSQNSEQSILEDSVDQISSHTTFSGEEVIIKWKDGKTDKLTLSLKGHVMANNCALALLTLRTLNLYSEDILPALEKATLRGRFEQLSSNPNLYIDGAHTPVSLGCLIDTISQIHDNKKTTIIFGAIEDKDHIHLAKLITDHFDKIIISRPGTFKKSNPEKLFNLFKSMINDNQKLELIEDGNKALKRALEITPTDGAILACGSFYLASEIAQAQKEL